MSHFEVRCGCGLIVSQCNCNSPNKQQRLSNVPCIHKIPAPPKPQMPKLPEILDKEGFKHIDEAVANYNIACVTLKEIMNKIKDVSLNKEQARMRVKELDIELSDLDIEKSRVYSLKLELGEKLLKAAEG